MNDAERDAWLREALRHAPDADAVPPSGVSEAILLKARAAARGAAPQRDASRPANRLAALWDWLARPPVAAGFASVMAATLVGLMWWDRPMDEAMPRSPSLASDRAPAAPSPASTPPASAENSPLASTSPARAAAPSAMLEAPTAAPSAKLAEPAAAAARRSVDSLAKERAPAPEKKNEAPAPFPSTEMQRERPSPRQSLDAAADDARKKDVEAGRSRAADEPERADVPLNARPVAPPAENSVAAKAKGAAAAPPVPTPPAAATPPVTTAAPPAAITAAPARDRADAPRLQQPQGAFGGLREQDAAGLAASVPVPAAAPAPFRSESQRSGSAALSRAGAPADAVAPARVLAAIGAEPERWRRQTAGGDTVALDAGWRAWLAELDAAAAGRWQPLAAAAPPEGATARDGATTLRLVNAGRVAAIVRLQGTTVQVDAAPGTGADRWQATLGASGAEQLRSSARRLSP